MALLDCLIDLCFFRHFCCRRARSGRLRFVSQAAKGQSCPTSQPHVPRHETGDAASIFGLFVPYQAPRVQTRRTPQPSAQARAAAKSFEPPKVRSKRETPRTPRLAAIVKPKPVAATPKETLPEPPSKPASVSLVKPRPRPVPPPAQDARKYDCEQAREIIGKYAFGNIQAKSCEGEVYSFAAMRSGKPFVVKISALNGELLEVKKPPTSINDEDVVYIPGIRPGPSGGAPR